MYKIKLLLHTLLFWVAITVQLNAQVTQDVYLTESKSTVHRNFQPKDIASKIVYDYDNRHIENMTVVGGRLYSQTDETGNYTRKPANAGKPFVNHSGITDDPGNISYEGAEGLRLTGVTKFTHSSGEMFIVMRRRCDASGVGATNNQFLMAQTDSAAATNYFIASDFANSSGQNNSIGINSSIAGTSNIGYCATKSLSDKKILINIHSSGTSYTGGFDHNLAQSMTWNSNNGDWFNDMTSSNLFTFGYRKLSSGTSFSSHYEYRVILYNQELTTTERAQVVAYLNVIYNCYSTISYALGAVLHGSSNMGGQSVNPPNRLKVALPKGYIQTGTNVFSNILFGTNNEGDGGSSSQFGSELSFTAALSEYLNQDIYIEKHGVGGSRFCIIDGSNPATASTNSWNTAAGDLYPVIQGHAGNLQTRLTSVNASNKCIYFLIGGENDSFYTGDANGFQTNLEAVITGISAQMTNMNIYLLTQIKTQLGGSGSGTPKRVPDGVNTVRDAIVSVKNNHGDGAVLLNMAPYTTPGDVHYADIQQLLIGRDGFELVRPKL